MSVRNPHSKTQHIDACLTSACEYKKTAGFENYEFENQALCEVSLEDIDISTQLAGKSVKAPLMISPMTGGVERAQQINEILASAAEKWQLPMGVGSQRVGIENEECAQYFEIRKHAPTTFIFANIGGAQLVKGWGVDHALKAVDMVKADALFLHLNPIQEAIQGGDQDFRGLGEKIADLCKALKGKVPVFAREVGFGVSQNDAKRLVDAGIYGIDCAGAGGTSWAKVEGICAKSERRRLMGEVFGEWGIPTAKAIKNVRAISADIPLIATGGLRSGVDVAKAIALGADIGSMARPFLMAAHEDRIEAFIERTLTELRICMFGIGAKRLEQLKDTPFLIKSLD